MTGTNWVGALLYPRLPYEILVLGIKVLPCAAIAEIRHSEDLILLCALREWSACDSIGRSATGSLKSHDLTPISSDFMISCALAFLK